jgi:hypothetical protein
MVEPINFFLCLSIVLSTLVLVISTFANAERMITISEISVNPIVLLLIPYVMSDHCVWGAFAKLQKAIISFVLSVRGCVSAWNNSIPTGQISAKFFTLYMPTLMQLRSLCNNRPCIYYVWAVWVMQKWQSYNCLQEYPYWAFTDNTATDQTSKTIWMLIYVISKQTYSNSVVLLVGLNVIQVSIFIFSTWLKWRQHFSRGHPVVLSIALKWNKIYLVKHRMINHILFTVHWLYNRCTWVKRDCCRVLQAKKNTESKGMYWNNKTWLAARVWSVATVGNVESDGFFSSFEVQDVVNIDRCNLLNLAWEYLWSSGVHVKKSWRTFIWGLYKPPHGGRDIKSTVERMKRTSQNFNFCTY